MDTDGESIQGQRFSATGERVDGEFTVNNLTPGSQDAPSVTMDDWGDLTVAWAQGGPTATAPSQSSVRARRFRVTNNLGDRVFTDGDGDGVQDPGEAGVVGVGVELHANAGGLLATRLLRAGGLLLYRPRPRR